MFNGFVGIQIAPTMTVQSMMKTFTGKSHADSPLSERSFLTPAWCAFIGSLILSSIAISGTELPNRDGMLYIDTASIFLHDGLAAARASFDWVFFPTCIAFLSKATGLGLESAAYVLSALLLACVCATQVRVAQIQFPSAAWYACLVVLTLPSFNEQRNEIIREFGWWLFCLQALLAAFRWEQQPGLRTGLEVQVLLVIACLFRIEAAVFFVALALWQLAKPLPWKQRFWRLSTLVCLPAAACIAVLGLLATGQLEIGARIANYASAINPAVSLKEFRIVAAQFGSEILNRYSADEAGTILFFGLISTVVVKFITHNGILLIPCAVFLWSKPLRRNFSTWQPQSYFFATYVATLIAFVTHYLFISGRYVIFLNILTMPLIAIGMREIFEKYPRWRIAFLLIALATSLVNVVSLSPKKTQFRDAGNWLAAHSEIAERTYIDSPRTRYFAGPAYRSTNNLSGPKQFDFLVIELSKHGAARAEQIRSAEFDEEIRFSNKAGDAVVVLRRKSTP